MLKRKVAEYYVAEGRAEWIGSDERRETPIDLLRLILSHPKNMAAAARASAYRHDVICGGIPYRDACREGKLKIIRPAQKAPAFDCERRMVSADRLLADPMREVLHKPMIARGGVPVVDIIPKPQLVPPSTIGRYSATLPAFAIGDPRAKRKKLEENKAAGR